MIIVQQPNNNNNIRLALRHVNGYPERPPVRPNISLGDTLAGLHSAFGTTMALLHRFVCAWPLGADFAHTSSTLGPLTAVFAPFCPGWVGDVNPVLKINNVVSASAYKGVKPFHPSLDSPTTSPPVYACSFRYLISPRPTSMSH